MSTVQSPSELSPGRTASFRVTSVNGVAGNHKDLGFNDESSFNQACKRIISTFSGAQNSEGANFRNYLSKINLGDANSIVTGWGGVYITKNNDPEIEKYLVVKGEKYLAFEWHTVKQETLKVAEGFGVLLTETSPGQLALDFIKPGFEKYLPPTQKHCLIAITDLLVFETSKDFKGMDKDLMFVYMPE